jgi:hypothetical protein
MTTKVTVETADNSVQIVRETVGVDDPQIYLYTLPPHNKMDFHIHTGIKITSIVELPKEN